MEASLGCSMLLKWDNKWLLELFIVAKMRSLLLLLVWVSIWATVELGPAAGNVVLIGNNVSLSFEDVEASFAPAIKGSGEHGFLYLAEPLDACTPLQNKVIEGSDSLYVLIVRGGCKFDEKVRRAQKAGFKAAIVYNNEDSGALIAMAGTPGGIRIPAVFVSKASGGTLTKYAGHSDTELWIIPSFENSAWSIMAISFISLLAMSAVLATCFFVRRHRIRREQPRAPNIREFHGMSRRLVKAMPTLIFTSVLEDNSTSATCAICLEDYSVGEKLRLLPCCHKFHAICVDSWLTTWKTFCPVCKQDARTSSSNPPPSECTPLISSAGSTPNSSFHSSIVASSPIQINSTPPRSPLTSRAHSLSGSIPRAPNSRGSYSNSPVISINRSSTDLTNMSYLRPRASPHSLGLVQSSPINLRYMSPYIPSSSNASPSYLAGSSSRLSYLHHCTESGVSALDSMHSLPEC
ncbi:receptor homology region, transmembrane domain- and RING domain-containing protein 1-like isoform X1 [Iris pallida]|uniref:Receptor homology region, transmembrane domain-and RING domain-containing protein 1-like isoform X1 n=1 Tax=Iris pallida TaxID=29817 RepID=A0AAX6HLY2_IRIPA|nr:receptor homology region, transmembrane domain- and RING domain-containing protein 1-like isoform X1 [Iris pallida]KAJ6849488.1 receptor homology region, transmembrane domain- and RING domain-containing protein 1-like isoform X1 [Iris pallida]